MLSASPLLSGNQCWFANSSTELTDFTVDLADSLISLTFFSFSFFFFYSSLLSFSTFFYFSIDLCCLSLSSFSLSSVIFSTPYLYRSHRLAFSFSLSSSRCASIGQPLSIPRIGEKNPLDNDIFRLCDTVLFWNFYWAEMSDILLLLFMRV